MDGVLLIDKPVGPTSFDVVRQIRKRARIRRVGHAGTLDPLASGLLIVCLGQGTKLVPYLMDGEKRYHLCVHCHSPHNPKFKPIEPMPPPEKPRTPKEKQANH